MTGDARRPGGSTLPPALHAIALAGFVARVAVSITMDWSHQPDEVFQYLEQGHRLAFGYGFVPWEFVYGVRSWMIPGTIAGFLFGASVIGLDRPELYIPLIHAVFCILSISLVYGSFALASRLADRRAGLAAAFAAAFWYEFVLFASKPTPEVLGAYAIVGMLALAVGPPTNAAAFGFGVLSALTVALRLQYAPVVAVAGISVLVRWRESRGGIARAALAALAVGAAYGLLDHVTWGMPFASMYNNLLYNQVYGVANVFGKNPAWYYGMSLGVTSAGVFLLLPAAGLWQIRRTWFPLLCAAAILLSHTLIPHKEHRFIFGAIALLWIVGAIAMFRTGTAGEESGGRSRLRHVVAFGFLAVTVSGLLFRLPGQWRVYDDADDTVRTSVNRLWEFLREEEDLRAILLLNPPWFLTDGYYRLHRSVPIYLPHHMGKIRRPDGEIHPIVTHVVCRTTRGTIPGFRTYRRSGEYEIRRRSSIESEAIKPGIRYDLLPQPGVTDRFRSRVRKRL